MTNMTNIHTLTVGRVHLIMPLVLVANSKVVEFAGDVMCSPGIRVPIGVYTIGSGMHFLVFICVIIIFIFLPPEPAVLGGMTLFVADLTSDVNPRRSATSATPTSAASSIRSCTATSVARAGNAILALIWAFVTLLETTTRRRSAAAAIAATTGAHCCIGRRVKSAVLRRSMKFLTLILSEHLCIQIIERDWCGHETDGTNQIVIIRAEPSQHIGDYFVFIEHLAGSTKFISQACDLGEKRRGGHVQFLSICNRDSEVVQLGTTLRRKHVLDRLPNLSSMIIPSNLDEDLLRERGDEVAENLLIPDVPGDILRIDFFGRFALVRVVRHQLGGHGLGAISDPDRAAPLVGTAVPVPSRAGSWPA